MRVGVISDIHNNAVAPNVVLEKLQKEKCERIICCGDIIGIGPYPEETVQRVMQIPGIIAVRGNHERYLLEGMPTQVPNEENMGYEEMEHHKWEHSLLSNQSIEFLRSLACRCDFILGGLHFAVMHYGMDDSAGSKYRNHIPHPTLEDCYQMFSKVDADIVLYGHNHASSINRDERKLFANFGSLGCPAKDGNIARAGIIAIDNGNLAIEPVSVPYEVDKVIAEINRLAYPASEEIKMFFFNAK